MADDEKLPCGFAVLPPEERSRIGARGGRASQASGCDTRFEEGSQRASECGEAGGKTHSKEHMREIASRPRKGRSPKR